MRKAVYLSLLVCMLVSFNVAVPAGSQEFVTAAEQLETFPGYEEFDGLQAVVAKRWLYVTEPYTLPGVMLWEFDSAESASDSYDVIAERAPQLWLVTTFSPSYALLEEPFARTAQFVIDPVEQAPTLAADRVTKWEFGLRLLPSGRAEGDRPTEVVMAQRGNVITLAGVAHDTWMGKESAPEWFFASAENLVERVVMDGNVSSLDRLPVDGIEHGTLQDSETYVLFEAPPVEEEPTSIPGSTVIASDPENPAAPSASPAPATPASTPGAATPES